MSRFIIEATQDNFNEAVLSNSHKGPVLVNYWADNAGPCLRLWPVLEKLANDYAGQFLLVNVDTNDQRQLAQEYGVNSVPTVKLFVNGEVVEQVHGYDSPDSFKKLLNKYLARESDKALAAAVTDYQQGNKEAAFDALNKLVFTDPENDRILLAYAKLLMREQAYEQAFSLLEKTPLRDESEEAVVLMCNAVFLATQQKAKPLATLTSELKKDENNCENLFQLCSYRMLDSDFGEAMEILLKIIKLDRDWMNQSPSLCLRGLFIMLGKDDERVRDVRQRLLDQTR